MEALLHVNHLEKNLDEFVLKDVNLTLQPGYIMGLIGVNGTGKTTLIQTILNLYKKDAGDVYVNGYSMEEQEREAKDQIGFVLDKNVFEESLSVWKNAKLFGKLYSRFDEEVFRECCERFQVPLNQKVGKLSTGYQVRFQLAFALSHDAKLFILDEPASGLGPIISKRIDEISAGNCGRWNEKRTYVHAYHRRFGSHRRLYIADERWTDCMGLTNRRSAGALSDRLWHKRRGRTVSARKSDLQVFWRIQKLCIYQKRYEYRLWKI